MKSADKDEVTEKDFEKLQDINYSASLSNGDIKTEKELLKSLRKILQGHECAHGIPDIPKKSHKKKAYYDIYSRHELESMSDLETCTLHMKNAHFATASIIKHGNRKEKKISILSRRNCGYNTFEGDTVLVKINDRSTMTGKVMGVVNSYHKPMNSLYICKVCRDQGSLMTPLDNTFPKIHVDNEPGRRRYEFELKNKRIKGNQQFKMEQKSVEIKARENSRFADNIYATIYEVTYDVTKNKILFLNPQIEKIDPETCNKLFLVCYQYWDISLMYPSGKIVGMISTYDSFHDTIHLILPLCKIEPVLVNKTYKNEIKIIKKKVRNSKYISNDILPKGAVIFTIDNEDTQDMDDALSYHVTVEEIVIGVHITDITKYISPQHEIYKQAKRRFFTAYAPKEFGSSSVSMLEETLSSDLFSLLPHEPRAVITIMFHFTRTEFPYLKKVTFGEIYIKSNYKLNYKQVEKWINATEKPFDVDQNLFLAIKDCFTIARQIRHARLPDSYFVRQSNYKKPGFQFDDSFNAQILVEEFMIMANEHVAKKIFEKYPNMTLIRTQLKIEDYEEWEDSLFKHTNTNFISSLKQYCNLLDIRRTSENRNNLWVSVQFFSDFKRYLTEDLSKAKNMLQYDEYINDFFIHMCEWYELSSPAKYECSIEGSVENGHFSLAKDIYTHFTSPIRRFSDIIVHRLLKSVINSREDVERLNVLEIDEVCEIGNEKMRHIKLFEKYCAPYATFEFLTKNFILYCICSKINNEEIQFIHPALQNCNSIRKIKFSHLSLNASPVRLNINEYTDACDLKWKKVIYSAKEYNAAKRKFVIDNDIYDVKLNEKAWKLFCNIRRSYLSHEELADKLRELGMHFSKKNSTEIITSNRFIDPIIEIQLNVTIKNTLKIQFFCYKVNGLKRINPELLIVHPCLQLCLIHQEDPVMCFVPGGKLELEHNDILWQFNSVNQYKRYFMPLIQLERLKEVLDEKSEFTCLDVPINWITKKSEITGKLEKFGVLEYSAEVYEFRNIDFDDDNETKDIIKDNIEDIIESGLSSLTGNLVCLRATKKEWDNYWVGHGVVVTVGKYQVNENVQTKKVVMFMLTHSDFDIFEKEYCNMTFVVEHYARSISAERELRAVAFIHRHKFLKQIVLGEKIISKDTDENTLSNMWKELSKVNKHELNPKQKKAIINAMTKKLSLIWGPPGTGKTSIGCLIAYSYCLNNKNEGQVLYCGPSNDCVNVVLDAMIYKFQNYCPKMLRIFSKKQELADFQLPGQTTRYKPLPKTLLRYSLHHLIRNIDSDEAKEIKKLDNKFKKIMSSSDSYHGTESIYSLVTKYKKLVSYAKEKFVRNNYFHMVLCTTSISVKNIMKNFIVRQVILDEAGMCKEPETLQPLINSSKTVETVVLIGDHKQLRPIILDDLASKRGLQISLFERYQLLRPESVTMLDQQYRMHPSICEFPSVYFYAKCLFTEPSYKWSGLHDFDFKEKESYSTWNGTDYSLVKPNYRECLRNSGYIAIPDKKWPGQRNKSYLSFKYPFNTYPERLVFIHVVGEETVQSISTSTCGENSRANLMEIEVVGYVYEKLIRSIASPVKAVKHITVLTQYRLQEDLLLAKCKEKIKDDSVEPVVKTVIKSQGSENDYVIFSTVRSLKHDEDIMKNPSPGWENKYLGFITDDNQVNVALTRAQKGLIIIGNKNLLSVNKIWKKLLDDLDKRGCVISDYKTFL